jgi:Ca2+-binding EF-hand superfamily protein
MKARLQRWRLTSAVLVLASMGCAATAQDRPGRDWQTTPVKVKAEPSARERVAMEAAFSRADVNGDGKLSRAEAAHLPAIEARFDELDTNHDGFLSVEEFIIGAMSAA